MSRTTTTRRQEIAQRADAGDPAAMIAWAILEVADAIRAHSSRMCAAAENAKRPNAASFEGDSVEPRNPD